MSDFIAGVIGIGFLVALYTIATASFYFLEWVAQ